QFLGVSRQLANSQISDELGKLARLKVPQRFERQAFTSVAGRHTDLRDAEDERHHQRKSQRDIGNEGGDVVEHEYSPKQAAPTVDRTRGRAIGIASPLPRYRIHMERGRRTSAEPFARLHSEDNLGL